MSILAHLSDTAKHWGAMDNLSVAAVIATYLGWIPHIAAFLSVVWFGLKIAIAWQEYRLNQRKLKE